MATIDENALSAADKIVEFMDDEGIIDLEDGVMKADMMVNHVAGIIRKQFAEPVPVKTITIDELEEATFFNAQREKLREY